MHHYRQFPILEVYLQKQSLYAHNTIIPGVCRVGLIIFNLHIHVLIISCTHSYPHRELERQALSNRKMSKKERRKKMEGSSDEESGGDLESVGGELSGSGVWGVHVC